MGPAQQSLWLENGPAEVTGPRTGSGLEAKMGSHALEKVGRGFRLLRPISAKHPGKSLKKIIIIVLLHCFFFCLFVNIMDLRNLVHMLMHSGFR